MPSEQADRNGGMPLPPAKPVLVAEIVTEHTVAGDPGFAEKCEARARAWDRTVSELGAIRDETDTDEVWSEVLRNLNAPYGGSH